MYKNSAGEWSPKPLGVTPGPTHRPPKGGSQVQEGVPSPIQNFSKPDSTSPFISKRVSLLPFMELFSCNTPEELKHKLDCELARMRSLNLHKRPPGRLTATEASLGDLSVQNIPKPDLFSKFNIVVCDMPPGIPFALVTSREIVFPVKGGFEKVRITADWKGGSLFGPYPVKESHA